MTCEEFWNLANKFEGTPSEHIAATRHYLSCGKCRKELQESSAVMEAGLSPEQLAEVDREVAVAVVKDLKALLTDTELR